MKTQRTESTTTTMNAFTTELTKTISHTIANLDRSTVGISSDCLWQLTAGRIARECTHAPKGTNCAYVARQTFNDIIRRPPFDKFVYNT